MASGSTSAETLRPSVLFPQTFTDVNTDPVLWNKEWEKALHTLPSRDVYAALSKKWAGSWPTQQLHRDFESIKSHTLRIQHALGKFWESMAGEGDFRTVWLLLEQKDRQVYLLQGLKEACQHASWHQDGRALCPEIRMKSLLKHSGRPFVKFIADYCKGIKDVGENTIYHLPSKWWDKAVNPSERTSLPSVTLTVQRDEFISFFLLQSGMAVVQDVVEGSNRTDPVRDIIGSTFGRGMIQTVNSMRDKPAIRCENCTKRPEDIGRGAKFMVCSVCKIKLDFDVHYCSHACQKEDWSEHKKICGKEEAKKVLLDTVRDPLWKFPNAPAHLRDSIAAGGNKDNITVTSLGLGVPHPLHPHSPALQLQLLMLKGNKDADYFIFDANRRPVPLVIPNIGLKMIFQTIRMDAMCSEDQTGVEAMTEYIIKEMQGKSGLTRQIILAQLSLEYGMDVDAKLKEFTRVNKERMREHPPGTTFVEVMSKVLAQSFTRIVSMK